MDELIHVPGEGEGGPAPMGKGTRSVAVGLLLLSSLAIVATIAVDVAFPAPIKNPVGQEARDLRLAERSRSLWDGSAANWAETQLKTRSRVRRSLAPFWSAFLMDHLGTVPRDLVAGEDGWLFLRDRVVPPVSTRARAIHLTGLTSAAMDRRLARLGSELIFMPIPRKAVAVEEKLPRGMKGDVGYEIGLQKALERRGLTAVDVAAIMAKLPAEERYFRRDSHWTFTAANALAITIAQTFPELATREVNIKLREKSIPASAHLLTFAAIDRDHPAADWINQDVVSRPVIKTAKVLALLKKRPVDVDVAVVGSSFTRNYYFAELVAASLGRLVYPGGIAATPFGGSLAYFAGAFKKVDFPKHVLYEFPVHQIFGMGTSNRGVVNSLTAFFVATSQAGTMPLPADLLGPPTVPEIKGKGVKVLFPMGTLLSTGDGVLQLRIKSSCDASSDWKMRSSDMGQAWVLGEGEHDTLLPVIQTHVNGHALSLEGFGKGKTKPEFEFEVVVDADLNRSVEVPLSSDGGSSLKGAPSAASVGAHDVATVQWAGTPDSVDVLIRGVTPDGEEREVHGDFGKPVSRICVMSLTPFEGGTVTSIEVLGATEGVRAFIAPQLED